MSAIYSNIVKSFSYLSILIELSNGKKLTGYKLMIHLKENFGFEVSPGTIYHQLGMLSRNGIIRGEKLSKNRTVYEMTEKGIEVFNEFTEKWKNPLEYAYKNLNK